METALPGVLVVEPDRLEDERGFFARTFADDEFAARGLKTSFPQCSVSFNRRAGTLRGLHIQVAPHEEVKLIRCTAGAVFDVALDLRPESPTYRRWCSIELSRETGRMVYIPEGVAHGFQTLADDTELFYQISARFEPSAARGIRWNDPAFNIDWPPTQSRVLSSRDRSFPDFAG